MPTGWYTTAPDRRKAKPVPHNGPPQRKRKDHRYK